jgi:hypothetical protein
MFMPPFTCYYLPMARPSPLAEALRSRPGHMVGVMSFPEFPASTVAHGLARLARRGALTRVRRGLYYVPRTSRFGAVPPDPIHAALGAIGEVRFTPGGIAAANVLGFTTQLPMGRTDVVSTRGRRIRRKGMAGIRILERPLSRKELTADENAFLEVLRDPEHLVDLSPEEASARAVDLVATGRVSLPRLVRVLWDEPPRVRAMVGALAEATDAPTDLVSAIRGIVNPRSRYSFGPFAALSNARRWGARS